jgi:hypothetical protein
MYEYKYIQKSTRKPHTRGGRHPQTEWLTGSDPVRRDKYYAWMKHRAQAKFRGEDYHLAWPEWEALWSDELWHQRGRTKDCYCLMRVDLNRPWQEDNVEVVTKSVVLKRSGEYRKHD